MSKSGYSYGLRNDLAGVEATSAATAPDFVRHDRGAEDEHWAHAFGEACVRCTALIEEGDAVRRRGTGGWVHERCPARTLVDDF
jgi:hypothetical protein